MSSSNLYRSQQSFIIQSGKYIWYFFQNFGAQERHRSGWVGRTVMHNLRKYVVSNQSNLKLLWPTDWHHNATFSKDYLGDCQATVRYILNMVFGWPLWRDKNLFLYCLIRIYTFQLHFYTLSCVFYTFRAQPIKNLWKSIKKYKKV